MNAVKERILARIREGLQQAARSAPPAAAVDDALQPRPQWNGSALDRFLDRLQRASAGCRTLAGADAIPAAVRAYLSEAGLPLRLRIAPHPLLQALSWPSELEITTGVDSAGLLIALSVADAAIAETGTLVLCSGPQSPTTLDFLPDHHLVVLRQTDLVPYLEDVWPLLRGRGAFPPRSLNLVTGPSRTADVEQTLQLGAHGPRQLHVLLLP